MKTCTRCKRMAPISTFGPNRKSRDGLHSWCHPCRYAWKQNKLNPDYDAMLLMQGARCANPACGTTVPGGYGRFHTDHDHACCKTGCEKCRRGLLCHTCNTMVRNLDLMLGAIQYLGWYGERKVEETRKRG